MIPRWSTRAKEALVRLFQPLQDIDVYVEDDGDEAFYRMLFERLLPELRIMRVFARGSRDEVLEAAAHHDFSARRALFLIDGDLSWVRGEPAPSMRGVFRLPCYCIENVLICSRAASEILAEQEAILVTEASDRLEFEQWKESVSSLVDLFVGYAVLNKIDASQPTVSIPLGRILSQPKKSSPTLDPAKVRATLTETVAKAKKVADESYVAAQLGEVLDRVLTLPDPLSAVSGKNHLLPLLHFHLHSHTNTNITRRTFRFRLAKHCSLAPLIELRAALIATCRAPA